MNARFLVFFATLLLGRVTLAAPVAPLTDAPQTLTTQFTYTATVPSPAGARGLNVWLPIPSDSVWQAAGGLMVFLHVSGPTGPLTATVRFTVRRGEGCVLGPAGDVSQDNSLRPMLGPDARVPIGGRFQAIARQVTQGDAADLDKEHALFSHVVTMHYDYHRQSPEYAQGDAAFVCDYKAGNCSDLHSYLIALSRSLGIAAELEFGFPLTGIPTPGTLPVDGTITGCHCWVWFRDKRMGWVPLDAADARVSMSHGRDIVLSPAQKAAPLNYFICPYAEADGAPATWTLTYHLPTGGKS